MLPPRAQVACARLSAVVLAVTVVAIGVVTPGYRPLADTVSRLGSPGQPHAAAARAAFVLYGLLVIAGAPATSGSARLVRIYGAAAVVAGLAPKDLPGTPQTVLSAVHVDATILGGMAILAAMLAVGRDAAFSSTRRRASLAAAGVTSVAAVAFRLCWGSAVYGLVERLVLAVPALWVALPPHESVLWLGSGGLPANQPLRFRRRARGTKPSMATARFAPELRTTTEARRFVEDELRPAGVGEDTLAHAQLVVTELVTNAVRHAQSAVDLTIAGEHGRVRIEARDDSTAIPIASRVDTETRHRGLQLIEDLSEGWGVDVGEGDGKIVWCELASTGLARLRSAVRRA